jgi:archaellum biogenesis ATPase FlaH
VSDTKEYLEDIQKLFLEFLISDKELLARTNAIINPEYFHRTLKPAAEFLVNYANEYTAVPSPEQVKATTGVDLTIHPTLNTDHHQWFLDEFEQFCKYKALEKAILKSADLLEKNDYGKVEKLIKEAVEVGLAKGFGTDYFADPAARLTALKNRNGGTTTGWKSVDDKLYGGFNRGELNIFAGGSGAGKSLFLQNLALNWSQAGFNVVYLSLELSEGLCSLRMDSMLTGTSTKEIYKNLDDVDLKVRMAGKKSGKLQIVQLPNGITVNDLKAWLKEYTIQKGVKVDCIVIDYLDLMMPAGQKISVADLFIKDKLVSEELRNFAMQGNYFLATASQLNRAAVESVEFDHSHISGGLSKIQTADNVIGIFNSITMRERGRIQIQFMKTRSSSGVGQKVELAIDINTLRITDVDENDHAPPSSADVMFNKLKRQSAQENTASSGALDVSKAPWADNRPTGTPAWEKPAAQAGQKAELNAIQRENSTVSNVIDRSEHLRNLLKK